MRSAPGIPRGRWRSRQHKRRRTAAGTVGDLMKLNGAQNKWFWAWLVQMTIPKDRGGNTRAMVEVWQNLVVLTAFDEKEAWSKAWQLGKAEEGDSQGSLRLNGKPATTEVLGIEDIGLMHDTLDDGAEVLWRLKRCTQGSARSLVKSKKELLAAVKKELERR